MKVSHALGVVGLGAVLAVVSPVVASAVYSYHGSDYSYDSNSRTRMTACDRESDSTKVKAVYHRTGAYGLADIDVYDTDGNNGVCGSGNLPSGTTVIEHKTCEYRSFWPDACGNWQAA